MGKKWGNKWEKKWVKSGAERSEIYEVNPKE